MLLFKLFAPLTNQLPGKIQPDTMADAFGGESMTIVYVGLFAHGKHF